MNLPYQFTPYMLPMLASAVFTVGLVIYMGRYRSIPGAQPLALGMVFSIPWAVGAGLELAAGDPPTKLFWFKVQTLWQIPMMTAALVFVLEYANLGHWLTHRRLLLLLVPILFHFWLVLANDPFHWLWLDFTVGDDVRPIYGLGNRILVGYGYMLSGIRAITLFWLFIRSPRHRAPVALMLGIQPFSASAYFLDTTGRNPVAPMDPTILTMTLVSVVYALALFRFRLFDPIPVARATVIEQMQEGMLVLDTQGHIVDLNPAAEKILSQPAARFKGQNVEQVLPVRFAHLTATPSPFDTDASQSHRDAVLSEITLHAGNPARIYSALLSPLNDSRGFVLGFLMLLHDMTEQKQAQAQLLEQQRAQAAVQERERLGHELHDNLAQALGYIKMKVHVAREALAEEERTAVDRHLAQLEQVAQEAHSDVRDYLLGIDPWRPGETSFLSSLHEYLCRYQRNYQIETDLRIAPEITDHTLNPTAQVQALRIIQEALANARKHACAHRVCVRLSVADNCARIAIEDDGCGFDANQAEHDPGQHYGLCFMRERAAGVGGNVKIDSAPGQGTRVVIQVPVNSQP